MSVCLSTCRLVGTRVGRVCLSILCWNKGWSRMSIYPMLEQGLVAYVYLSYVLCRMTCHVSLICLRMSILCLSLKYAHASFMSMTHPHVRVRMSIYDTCLIHVYLSLMSIYDTCLVHAHHDSCKWGHVYERVRGALICHTTHTFEYWAIACRQGCIKERESRHIEQKQLQRMEERK